MAEVALDVGGRQYVVSCRDGGEAHLRGVAEVVDARVTQARAAVGGVNEARQLLLAALLLADELADALARAPNADIATPELSALATRIEAIADALERGVVAS